MSIWHGERGNSKQQSEGSRAFHLGGGEFHTWAELQSPAGNGLIDMKSVLDHVYAYAAPTRRRSEPNTMLVLAAGALGVLALRRSRQQRQEGVLTND